jgi:hypothetical protein
MKPLLRSPAPVVAASALAWLLAPAPAAAGDGEEAVEEAGDETGDEGAADEEAAGEDESGEGKVSEARLLLPCPDGALVLIDGEEVGTAPLAPVTGLTVGTHKITATKEGFANYAAEVAIPEEGTIRHDILFTGGKKPRKPVPKFLKAWWFWTAIGVVVATGTGVGIYLKVRPEEPNAVSFPPY